MAPHHNRKTVRQTHSQCTQRDKPGFLRAADFVTAEPDKLDKLDKPLDRRVSRLMLPARIEFAVPE